MDRNLGFVPGMLSWPSRPSLPEDSLIHFALSPTGWPQYDHINGCPRYLASFWVWISGWRFKGWRERERGQWCQGYYAIHSFPVMMLESGCLSTEGPCFGQNKCLGFCISLSSKCPLSHPFPCFCVTSPAYCTQK